MKIYKFFIVLTAYILYVFLRRFPIRAFASMQEEINMSKGDLAWQGYGGVSSRGNQRQGAHNYRTQGVLQSTRLILREEGYGALWKGHVPAQGLSAMYGLVQFSSFEAFSLMVGDGLPPSSSDFFCGMLAGCFAMTCAMPLDVIRTRLVAQGTLHAVKHMWKREGVAGYFRGWVPSVIQIAPFTGLQFSFYNTFLELWRKVAPQYEATGALVSGAAAGTVAKTILYPLDMVRHRLQMNGFERKGFGKASRYQSGMIRAMAHVVKHESAYGLFKGLWPSQIKAAANSGTLVSSYSICFTVSKLLLGIASDRLSSVTLFILGLLVASLASIILAYGQTFLVVHLVMMTMGSVQGAAWVPATKLIAKWYEGSSFGIMFSLLGCGSTTAGLLLTLLDNYNWRDVEFFLGMSASIFCGLALFFLKNDNLQPEISQKNNNSSLSFKQIVSSNVLWGIALSYIFTLEARTVSETWLPLYVEEQNLSSSDFLRVNELSGTFGTLLSGVILDRLTIFLSEDTARRLSAVFFSLGMLLSFMFSTSYPNYYLVFAFLCGFFTNGSLNLWCLIMSVAGEKHIAGSCSAFMSFLANFGPILAGSPLAYLIAQRGYSVFMPFFAAQIVIFLSIILLRIPLRMTKKLKEN